MDSVETGDLDATQVAGQTQGGATSTTRTRGRGDSLGRYLVIEELGAGAMGVVYAAYDHELDRRVAIKLWHTSETASTTADVARTRLLREAQALARLSHPNVVGVHDVGTVDEEVFVAMEYVDGETLSDWLTRARRSWPEILAAFVAAGRGLAAAHAAGLVHRDFKPDNVMVGRDGRVRVMDFGLARAAGASETFEEVRDDSALRLDLTQTGGVLGTPAYMPSEQLHGAATDARSDQFAFCVALYEALVGERPFSGTTLAEVMVQVDAGTVAPPPRGSTVPAWLRRALLPGLRPDPKDRYPDMPALLAVLERGPRKWRRYALGGALLVAAVVLGVFAGRGGADVCGGGAERWAEVWQPARAAAVTDALVTTGRAHAADTAGRVVARVDAVGQAWVAMHREACVATRVRGEQSEALLDLRMVCLRHRLDEVDALARHLVTADAEMVDRAATAVMSLTPVAVCDDTAALMAAVAPPTDPEVRARVDATRARMVEAVAIQRLGRMKEALAQMRSVLGDSRQIGHAALTAEVLVLSASLEAEAGDVAATEQTLLLAIAEAARARDLAMHARAWALLTRFAVTLKRKPDEAARWVTPLTAAMDLAQAGPRLRAAGLQAQAEVHLGKGEPAAAETELVEAVALLEGEDGDELSAAMLLDRLGVAQRELARPDEARATYTRALAIYERILGPLHPRLAATLTNLANLATDAGDYEAAQARMERVLALREASNGPDHPFTGHIRFNLAHLARLRGDPEAARAGAERALAILEKAYGPDHADTAVPLAFLGVLARDEGRLDDAEALLWRAHTLEEAALGPDNPDVAEVLDDLGQVSLLRGRVDEAIARHTRALALLERANGATHPELARPLLGLAAALHAKKATSEALALAERALVVVGDRAESALPRGRARVAVATYLHALRRDPKRVRRLAETATLGLHPGREAEAIARDAAFLIVDVGGGRFTEAEEQAIVRDAEEMLQRLR